MLPVSEKRLSTRHFTAVNRKVRTLRESPISDATAVERAYGVVGG